MAIRSWRALGWPLGLLLLSLILYLPPYKLAFIGDDYLQLGYIAEFLDAPGQVIHVFNPFWIDWYYRPLQNVWLLICRQLFGLNPFGYYSLQGLWHILASASLLALARRLGLSRGGALVAVTLFVVNSHHHDVVAWISSISILMATTFSFLATNFYLTFLQRKGGRRLLLAVVILSLMAMLSHEEGILLPLFLLAARLTLWRRQNRDRSEVAMGIALLLLASSLGAVQFLRPNATIALHEQSPAHFMAALHPLQLAHYIVTVVGRWLLLNKSVPGAIFFAALMRTSVVVILAAILLVGGLIAVARRMDNVTRLSLLWIVLHLGFLYLAVWLQKPELFAGRHLYSSWAFVALALGQALAPERAHFWAPKWRAHSKWRLVLILLALILAANILLIGDDQRAWQQHTQQVSAVEAQMKRLIPAVSPETQIFAHRFVLLPSFTPYAAAVWYAEPGISGGSMFAMQGESTVTPSTYLLDYADGQLINLLPGLQHHHETTLLWEAPQATLSIRPQSEGNSGSYTLEQVAGPAHDRRVAVRVRPPSQGWLSLIYDVAAARGTHLATDVLGVPGVTFRVLLVHENGSQLVAFSDSTSVQEAGIWRPLMIPLEFAGERASSLRLEVRGQPDSHGYWSVPRLVQD